MPGNDQVNEVFRRKTKMDSDTWATPPYIVEWVQSQMGWPSFDFDPCASDKTTKAPAYITLQTGDGLRDEWRGSTVWLNPPYSEQGRWLGRAAAETMKGKRVAALVLPSWDTKYWRDAVWLHAKEVWMLEGRIAFENDGVPMPGGTVKSCLVIYDGPTKGVPVVRYYRVPKAEMTLDL